MNNTIQDALVDKNVIKIKPTIRKRNKNGNEQKHLNILLPMIKRSI